MPRRSSSSTGQATLPAATDAPYDMFVRPHSGQIEVMDDQMAEVLRAKTPAQRLEIAHGMWSYARDTLVVYLRSQHADWPEPRIMREVARRLSHGAV